MTSPLVIPSSGKYTLSRLDTRSDCPRPKSSVPPPPSAWMSSSWRTMAPAGPPAAGRARRDVFLLIIVPEYTKPPRRVPRRFQLGRVRAGSRLGDVGCLRSLLTLNDLEFDLVPLGQGLEAVSLDGAEVDEDVRSSFVR